MIITLPLWAAITAGLGLPALGAAGALLLHRPTAADEPKPELDPDPTAVVAVRRPWPTPLSPRLHEREQLAFAPPAAPPAQVIYTDKGIWTPAAASTTWREWDAVNLVDITTKPADVWVTWTAVDYLLVLTVFAGQAAARAAERVAGQRWFAATHTWLALHEPAFWVDVTSGRHRSGIQNTAPAKPTPPPVDDLNQKAAVLVATERADRGRAWDEAAAKLLATTARIGAHS